MSTLTNTREQFPIGSEWDWGFVGKCRVLGYESEDHDSWLMVAVGEDLVCPADPAQLRPIPEPTITIPRKVAEAYMEKVRVTWQPGPIRNLEEALATALKEQS